MFGLYGIKDLATMTALEYHHPVDLVGVVFSW